MIIGKKSNNISSIDDILEDAKQGKMFILMDDKKRENEGDLVILAEKVNYYAINMMINNGSGIICLSITNDYRKKLNLEFMKRTNADSNHTAFTTSIDARYGITTGVSAYDRTHTILKVMDENATKNDFVTPGHIFPIVAKEGGVLIRPGHTEASVDIAKLAGSSPAAVICELMNPDGTMARISDIEKFSQVNNIKITTINKLIDYIKNNQVDIS